jgi:hypothetical protein
MTEIHQVQPSDKLFRWLHPSQFNWNEMRPTSAAFKDSYMSVDIACITTLEESYKRGRLINKNAVASITVAQALEKAQRVHHCPTLCEISGNRVCITDAGCRAYQANGLTKELTCTNPAHGCVVGDKSKPVAKFFAKNATVEIYPPQVASDQSH